MRPAWPALPAGQRHAARGGPGVDRLHRLPASALARDLEHQPAGAVNKEIKRRTDVVGIFPDEAAITRLAGAVLLEVHDEWQIADRRYLSEGSMARLALPGDGRVPQLEVDRQEAGLLAS